MHVTMPHVDLPNDPGRIMSREGDCVGLTRSRQVWRFGFMSGSERAEETGTSSGDGFVWVLSDERGRVLETWHGVWANIPRRFRRVVEGAL